MDRMESDEITHKLICIVDFFVVRFVFYLFLSLMIVVTRWVIIDGDNHGSGGDKFGYGHRRTGLGATKPN